MGGIKRKNKPSLTKEEKKARQVLNADPEEVMRQHHSQARATILGRNEKVQSRDSDNHLTNSTTSSNNIPPEL
jgi:hypothetical protein